jgi:hypothetical protein
VPLIFANPHERTQPLFDRLQAATGNAIENVRVQIWGSDDLYSVFVRADGRDWHHDGSPDELVAAFTDWLTES